LDSRLEGYGTRIISDLFSNLLEDKDRRLKAKLTLSLILRVNLRLGGYSIWNASLIAPHIKEDLTTIQGMSTSSLDAAKEVLGRHLQDGVWENSKTPLEVLGSLQYLSDPSPRDYAHSVHILG
jgi:hypothetical protein